jgi:hypothetical protein
MAGISFAQGPSFDHAEWYPIISIEYEDKDWWQQNVKEQYIKMRDTRV